MASASAPPISVFRPDLLAGEVAIVSGGGTGLGRAIACACASVGATVAVFGRRAAELEETVRIIEAAGGRAIAIAGSIRDQDQVRSLFDRVEETLGGATLLVNNAGGQFVAPALDISPKGWRAVVDTNLTGTWYMLQEAAMRWRQGHVGGRVVNIVLDVWRGIPGMAHSVSARAGVIYLSRTLAIEWAPLGIRINCIAPGIVDTQALHQYPPETVARLRKDSNLRLRFISPEEIADSCIYLLSPASASVMGEVLTIDGGQYLWGRASGLPE